MLIAASLGCGGCVGTTPSSPEVRGRIEDAATKKPISAAVVQIAERPNTKVQSDADGRFRVPSRSNFHVAYIPGPCMWLYIPEGLPYSDDLLVTYPGYQAREAPAHTLSVTPMPYEEPERIVTKDIRLESKHR